MNGSEKCEVNKIINHSNCRVISGNSTTGDLYSRFKKIAIEKRNAYIYQGCSNIDLYNILEAHHC